MKLLERFLTYVKIDTQSDADSSSVPSTEKQLNLSKVLLKELHDMGIDNAHIDEFGVLYAHLAENTKHYEKRLGLIAHVDTASEMSGKDVNPRVIYNYDGSDIVLNADLKIYSKPSEFDVLKRLVGHDLVVTDGKTLLGADDKLGVAIIMDTVEYLVTHPEVLHGPISIAFTPDEEIGRGADHFDVKKFNADFAYTLDGDQVGVIEFENFNASSASVKFIGNSIHPGSAKGKLINAMHIAFEFHQLLPTHLNPALTEKYEGFNHLTDMKGEVNEAHLHYILRNHDDALIANQKQDFIRIQDFLNAKYGHTVCELSIKDSYKNMRSALEDKMWIVSLANDAIQKAGLNPISKPIRGGTDGARLTYMGLPCPNLGTGGYMYHGRHELASVQEMQKAKEIVLNIIASLVK